ncbi:hypothetical protein L1049_007848 [Liquidambar formosana]|uniref:FPL domain-containing protein n=1 Tax=Liquidambar formosana TaxID=63359 RepID=A0AAP0X8Q8_LIQFO
MTSKESSNVGEKSRRRRRGCLLDTDYHKRSGFCRISSLSLTMWRSFWRTIDRFSLQYFKYIINELREIKVVDKLNRELVVDILQSIVEIVTYGDRHDSTIFECFMEYQVLGEFVRVLKISRNSRIEAPLLQYLSIMIQNMESEYAIYYCFSNDYINSIITHQYEFDGGDLVPYYISFLRAVSGKINRDTLCLLVKVNEDVVVSFPLYSEALKFSQHGEKMIQIAVRAITLNIYNVSDDMVYQFITTPPISEYFSDLVRSLREQCLPSRFPCPCYKGTNLSAITLLYIVSRLLQVVDGKTIVNSVASVVLYPYMASSIRNSIEGETSDGISQSYAFSSNLNEMEEMLCSCPEAEGAENIHKNLHFGNLLEYISAISGSCSVDNTRRERGGILSYISSDNHSLLLSTLLFLLILAESKDLDFMLASMIGFSEGKIATHKMTTYDISSSQLADGSIFVRHMPQTSYQQSCERLQKELDGCWFDHIPDTLRNEWARCKTALEESSQSKDPFFTLELDFHQEATDGSMSSSLAWQRMVDAVKVFVLHLQLKAFMSNGDPVENPLTNLRSSIIAVSGKNHAPDFSSASFGSELALGSGIPCKIAFSKLGIKDIYLIPVARGITGKLLLLEKHPFHSKRGVVIAVAPLAGLSQPKKDENHPTWLHLQIREFDPKFDTSKSRGHHLSDSNHVADGKWTLGFSNAEACEAARLLILKETSKQRSSVNNLLAPLLQDNSLGDLSDSQGE